MEELVDSAANCVTILAVKLARGIRLRDYINILALRRHNELFVITIHTFRNNFTAEFWLQTSAPTVSLKFLFHTYYINKS